MARSTQTRKAGGKTAGPTTQETRRLLWIVPALVLLALLTWLGPGLFSKSPDKRSPAGSTASADTKPAADHILDLSPVSGTSSRDGAAKSEKTPKRRPLARPSADEMVTTGELGAMLLGVIGLIVAVAFGLRRVMRRARLAPGNEKILQVVDALPLGPKRHVYAVRMRDRLLVLGAGGEDISLLAEYEEEDWAAQEETSIAAAPAVAAPVAAPAPKATQEVKAPTPPAKEKDAGKPAPQATARAQRAYAANGGKKKPARGRTRPSEASASAGKSLPPGAHRVPPAFRHLLENAMDGEAS